MHENGNKFHSGGGKTLEEKNDNKSCAELIESDLYRLRQKRGFKEFIYCYFRRPLFRYQVWLRITHSWKCNKFLKVFSVFPWLIYRRYEFKFGVHISSNIEIGEGLYVVHGDGVYLNAEKIGKNLTVYQNVTLGIKNGNVPTVCDDVTIYPNVVVYGGVTIENNATIGANSVVNKDVPQGKTVVGAPAREIKSTDNYVSD